MKNLSISIFLSIVSLCSFAQAPIVYGTFLPVNGTQIKEVWDTTTNIMPMPTGGSTAKTWDYSLNFQKSDTFPFATVDPRTVSPSKTPKSAVKASNSAFVRAVTKASTADSLDLFYKIDYTGFYTVGAFDEKTSIAGFTKVTNMPYEVSDPELVVPFEITYPQGPIYDTMVAKSTFQIAVFGTITHKIVRRKVMSCIGYGTLKTPLGTFNNVLLTKEVVTEYDTVFNSANTPVFNFTSVFTRCNFLRNNTFASSVLMFIQDNDNDGKSDMAWFTLPVKFGSIAGIAYDSSGSALSQGSNEVWLYRDYSNFYKNDVLAKTATDASGKFKFDSIPFGYYRIAVRPDTIKYPHSLTTYFGDTSKTSSSGWLAGDTINTIGCECNLTGQDIKIKYSPPQSNVVSLSGSLSATFPFVNLPQRNGNGSGKNQNTILPLTTSFVKGIDIVVKKKPSGTIAAQTTTNSSGSFNLTTLDPGNYDVFVDVPGLGMTGTYSFAVAGNTNINCLDFTVDADSIYPTNPGCTPLSVREISNNDLSAGIFPNPFKTSTRVLITTYQKGSLVIELYNILGEKTATIENSLMPAGSYVYNIGPEHLKNPGIYFINLHSGNEHKSYKIIKD